MEQVHDVDEAVDGLVELYDHATALAHTILEEGTYDDYRDVTYLPQDHRGREVLAPHRP